MRLQVLDWVTDGWRTNWHSANGKIIGFDCCSPLWFWAYMSKTTTNSLVFSLGKLSIFHISPGNWLMAVDAWAVYKRHDTDNTIAESCRITQVHIHNWGIWAFPHCVMVTIWRNCLKFKLRKGFMVKLLNSGRSVHIDGSWLQVGKEHKLGRASTPALWVNSDLN